MTTSSSSWQLTLPYSTKGMVSPSSRYIASRQSTVIARLKSMKKVDLNALMKGKPPKHRMKVNFIRIGVLHANSPRKIEMQKDSDGLMIVTPPQLNGLRIEQQSFRQCVEQSKWNYLLEKKEEGGKDDDDKDNNDEDDNKGDNDDSDDNDEVNARSPPPSNKKRKYNTITPGVDDDMAKSDMAKAKSDMAKLYPHLVRALGVGEDGFDPTNLSVQKSMRSLLSELNDLLSTTYQLDVSGLSNKRISYVRVP
jgi:hypothetical protein